MIFATDKLNPRQFAHMLETHNLIPAKLNELTVYNARTLDHDGNNGCLYMYVCVRIHNTIIK